MSRRLLATCVMLCVATSAYAQEGGKQRGGRGAAGFGGMGRGGNSLMILQMEEVQKELTISDEQKKELSELIRSAMPQGGRGPGGPGGGGPGGGGPGGGGPGAGGPGAGGDPEQAAKMRESMAKRMKELEEGILKILKPEQTERFQQLRIQRDGVSALSRAEVAEKLAITAEQKEKIETIQQATRAAAGGRNFFELSDEDRQKLIAEMQEQRKKMEADIMAVLTDAQKQTLATMKGKEFEFPAGGRGGFGGGGAGGGERRRPEKKKVV